MPFMLYELLELLVVILALGFLIKIIRKWLITEPVKEKIETIKIVSNFEKELADDLKPIDKIEQNKAKKKIKDYIKQGESING